MEDGDTEKYHPSRMIQDFVFSSRKGGCIRRIFCRYIINVPTKCYLPFACYIFVYICTVYFIPIIKVEHLHAVKIVFKMCYVCLSK